MSFPNTYITELWNNNNNAKSETQIHKKQNPKIITLVKIDGNFGYILFDNDDILNLQKSNDISVQLI